MTVITRDVKKDVAKSILTAMALGLMGTAWAIYNDVQDIKHKDKSQDEAILTQNKTIENLGSDIRDIHWHLIDSKKPRGQRKYQQ